MIINGNALHVPLKAESVHCIVTSPPYWGLRKYAGLTGDQFGLEPTIELYIEHSMQVLKEAWRVLRKDGTCWWNLGDSYAGGGQGNYGQGISVAGERKENRIHQTNIRNRPQWLESNGLKPKDLCLVPYRFALAAQAAGWWVRSAIIWSKPNPMPESCTDRPTDSYENIFLLTKAKNYYYDAEAVREKGSNGWHNSSFTSESDVATKEGLGQKERIENTGRNLRNVWSFATQPYSEAHFATFPEELVRRCLLAGCPERCCEKCGAGWVRILGTETIRRKRPNAFCSYREINGQPDQTKVGISTKTLGWRPSCQCENKGTAKGIALDIFGGTGTVADVAIRSGRHGICLELSPDYIKLAKRRTENSRMQEVLL